MDIKISDSVRELDEKLAYINRLTEHYLERLNDYSFTDVQRSSTDQLIRDLIEQHSKSMSEHFKSLFDQKTLSCEKMGNIGAYVQSLTRPLLARLHVSYRTMSIEEATIIRKEAQLKWSGWSGEIKTEEKATPNHQQPKDPKKNITPEFEDTHPKDGVDSEVWIEAKHKAGDSYTQALACGETSDPDTLNAIRAGMVVIRPPIADKYLKQLGKRTYRVLDAPPGYQVREFGPLPNRHCSLCPFPDGCMMCTLP